MRAWKGLEFLLALVVLFTIVACSTTKTSKTQAPENKVLGTWQVKSLDQNGRSIDIEKIAGETFMEFYTYEKKDKDGNKVITYKYRMEMGGSDRMFDFKLVNDSIQFQKVKGWNDLKILELNRETGSFIVEQFMDGNNITWYMKLRADLDKIKEKQKAQEKKQASKNK